VSIPGGSAIVQPLDASTAFNLNDLVFWVGAKAYKFVAGVSKSFAVGISSYSSNAKACLPNGTCILNISVSNSSNSSWCVNSK